MCVRFKLRAAILIRESKVAVEVGSLQPSEQDDESKSGWGNSITGE